MISKRVTDRCWNSLILQILSPQTNIIIIIWIFSFSFFTFIDATNSDIKQFQNNKYMWCYLKLRYNIFSCYTILEHLRRWCSRYTCVCLMRKIFVLRRKMASQFALLSFYILFVKFRHAPNRPDTNVKRDGCAHRTNDSELDKSRRWLDFNHLRSRWNCMCSNVLFLKSILHQMCISQVH